MGGLALLARDAGHRVSGSDQGVYPPMSTQLAQAGIALYEGYDPVNIEADTELVIIGNALSRGNPSVEYVLNQGLPYASGAQWLGEHFLRGKHVLAVAGTHGKTTTSSMLAWLLADAGLDPGFLIGGVPENFGVSARPGGGQFFVIEADEYDTAFFDKRSKFVHYHPATLILNNLEFDHADIFADLDAIKTQFHHLIRTVPGNGQIVVNAADQHLTDVLQRGCWTQTVGFGTDGAPWRAQFVDSTTERIEVRFGQERAQGDWRLAGQHNLDNATAALAAAHHVGVPLAQGVASLAGFSNVKRRLELIDSVAGITVIDDFAHHPTAIATTIDGLIRQRQGRLIVALEPRSNSMKLGAHADELAPALAEADHVIIRRSPGLPWDPATQLAALGQRLEVAEDVDDLLRRLRNQAADGDTVVFMSNGGFDNAPRRFAASLREVGDD